MTLEGRTAVVTGAAQGIGEGIARAFLEAGARVAVADINATRAAETATALAAGDAYARAWAVDVRERASVARLIDDVTAAWGSVDIFVNNAAVNISRPFAEVEQDEWDEVLAVNLRGVLFGCQLAAEQMRPRGYGRIINIASDAGEQPNEFVGAHYAAAKGGVIVLTKVVALDVAAHGITVNAIAPASITGPVMDTLPSEQVAALERSLPVQRLGAPDEVGALAAFLASERAGFITGATYDINGGVFMR